MDLHKLAPLPTAGVVRASLDFAGVPLVATSAPGGVAVLRLDGSRWVELASVPSVDPAPHVQTLPDGRLLVVGTTSRRRGGGEAERNAAVFAADGRELGRFVAGDGVEDVQVTASGRIWVSYFDDGTMGEFGRFGWGRLSPEVWVEPVGGNGLVRFDDAGSVEYTFAPPRGAELAADCFALNVAADDAVWLSYHPGFPLVRIAGETTRAWQTGWRAVDALAVDGDRVLQYERFGEERDTCRLCLLGGEEAVEEQRVTPRLGAGAGLGSAGAVLGRGSALHAVADDGWYVVDLAEL